MLLDYIATSLPASKKFNPFYIAFCPMIGCTITSPLCRTFCLVKKEFLNRAEVYTMRAEGFFMVAEAYMKVAEGLFIVAEGSSHQPTWQQCLPKLTKAYLPSHN